MVLTLYISIKANLCRKLPFIPTAEGNKFKFTLDEFMSFVLYKFLILLQQKRLKKTLHIKIYYR